MSVVTGRNTRQGEGPPAAPLREDGSVHPFAMFYSGDLLAAYADSPAGLLRVLIEGYGDLGDAGRLANRLRFAVDVQVALQASLNEAGEREGLPVSDEESDVLNGPRHVPPVVGVWSCRIPLVLVDLYYAPFSDVPAPASGLSDTADPDNLVWLRPSDEWDLLVSLDRAGFIRLQQALA